MVRVASNIVVGFRSLHERSVAKAPNELLRIDSCLLAPSMRWDFVSKTFESVL